MNGIRIGFPFAVLTSAALVFFVEPMMARLLLPVLGGSSAVWNASLAFFQAALLLGYLYAHALQRLSSLRAQVIVHLVVLAAAALALPPGISGALGAPDPDAPAVWLLAQLAITVGAPFAALSATAPLLQAWQARLTFGGDGQGPWGLYAASNLGSLAALLAYPLLVEPNLTLALQTRLWAAGYGVFGLMIAGLGVLLVRVPAPAVPPEADRGDVTWRDRLTWVALAAIPSSLILGVTAYVTTDIGSAPFLWIAPLALYLTTFIIAFQDRPILPPALVLPLQALAVIAACATTRPLPRMFLVGTGVHFAAFFLTALMCHQALVARRPAAGRLTEFYLWMSFGGVLGGLFNAFLAPLLFNTVVEYPAALILSCLARPWARGLPARPARWLALVLCAALLIAAVLAGHPLGASMRHWAAALGPDRLTALIWGLILLGALLGALLHRRALSFTLAALIIVVGAATAADGVDVVGTWRGFYGVLRESRIQIPGLGGEVRLLAHGATLHGAEARDPARRCQPLLYYAHETPIGQVLDRENAVHRGMEVGAVGLGAGTVAAYDTVGDRFTFFEIDPLVAEIATDRRHFSYISRCAQGRVGLVLGDARQSLNRWSQTRFDVLLIDAFSSDSVPAHLLTVEALKLYLAKVKPDGVVVLHLTNRNLDLLRPAMAAAIVGGGHGLIQAHDADPRLPDMWEASEDALILSPTAQGLAPFRADPRWKPLNPGGVRAWTDDFSDLFGALLRKKAPFRT